MSVKQKWKTFGKSTGEAFSNFGKAMATTAKVALGKEERLDAEGNSTLRKSWAATGKGFGKAGTSLGKAAASTAKKAVGKDEEEPSQEPTVNEEDIIEAEIVSEEPAKKAE